MNESDFKGVVHVEVTWRKDLNWIILVFNGKYAVKI